MQFTVMYAYFDEPEEFLKAQAACPLLTGTGSIVRLKGIII